MFNYTTQNQLDIFNFKIEYKSKLDTNNRWLKMAKLLDWDKFAVIYGENISPSITLKALTPVYHYNFDYQIYISKNN
ncbi:MAG: hypothetical protein COZ76_06705 [Flavobacteriales bacterium CG_4_8_14_3_um_filter_35_10]|nr:MAG: hypothetical protein COZ76_06705 [Flavobacteriales bacterium CG_4_8_14_3_um_filter_35_10]